MLFMLLACTINMGKDDTNLPTDNTDTGDTGDSGTTTTIPPGITWTAAISTAATNNRLYDIDWVEGSRFVLSNPYQDGFTGALYEIDSVSTTTGFRSIVLDTDPANHDSVAVWTGSAGNAVLGVEVNVVTDGVTKYITSSEYGTTNGDNLGRFLAIPSSQGSGVMANMASLDVLGPSDGRFFGTGAAVTGAGDLVVSATTGPKLYSASPHSLNGGSIGDFTVDSQPEADTANSGFFYMNIAGGADGALLVSNGGLAQHRDTAGTFDWWITEDGRSGTGVMPSSEYARDINRECFGRRLTDTYALSCLAGGIPANTILVDPTDGHVVSTLFGVFDIVEGVTSDGKAWSIQSVLAYGGVYGKY